ncbi:hypothetical protein [Cereibacter sediminicola]|uniref:hypothetical protein n=1 Tax=Cereibacter sediminicola TaxID=2584941 RepID=UPI0011AB01C9|nr:hypothetical protein [Cereibacter sediminicola]
MERKTTRLVMLAGLFILTAAVATAQTNAEDHEAHHPAGQPEAATQAAPTETVTPEASPPAMTGGMTGMMSPEMMGMMQGMMPGMASSGMGGAMGCPMVAGGAAAGKGLGPDALYGAATPAREMTPERVRVYLQGLLDAHANPRLKLGEIAEQPDGNVIAEVRTVDGSLVQRLAFNRYPGVFRPLSD